MEQCSSLFKLHRVDGFHNRNLFLIILEAETSKVKVLVDSLPGEVLLADRCLLSRSLHSREIQFFGLFL